MVSLKVRLGCVPISVVLTALAMQSSSLFGIIAPGVASESIPQHALADASTAPRFPLVPLKKGEIQPLLAPLLKGGWGDQITQLAQSNAPPPRKNPSGTVSGGRRDPIVCPQDAGMPRTDSGLIALSPATKPGTTLAERPSFLVYVPKTSAKTAEFSLRDDTGRGVYRTTFTLTNTSGIISLSLPAQAPPLNVGEQYTWFFAIICDPNRRLNDRFVTGMVQRIKFDPTRLRQIQQASLREQVALYQKADAWYDTLAALFELQHTQPNNPSIQTTWNEFLQSGGVSVMLNKTLSQQNSP